MERSLLEGYPPKVVWVRLGNCSTSEIEGLLRSSFEVIRGFVAAGEETCLLLGRSSGQMGLCGAAK